MFRLNLAVTLFAGSFTLLAPGLADAHFMLVAPTSWWTQDTATLGSPQKTPPCGNEVIAGTSATGVMNVYQPGQAVSVTVMATVPHPGWWRISLRQGAASTQNATNFPDPPEMGAAGSDLQCTPAFINNPVWSPTQPVLADKLGLPPGATTAMAMMTTQSGMQTFQVTIPATATCSTASPCTLQVLMIMTDHSFPTCNYHHCANMVSSTGTTTGTGGATGATDAGTDARDARVDTGGTTGVGGSSSTGSGGATTTTGSGGATGTTVGTGGATGTTTGIGGATGTTTGTGGATGTTTADAGSGATTDSSGCSSCSTGGSGASWLGFVSALGAIAWLSRRRRRTR